MKNIISFTLLAIILLQSCVAYQNISVPINEAQNRGNVKVISKTGEIFKYQNITNLNDSVYFGVKSGTLTKLDPLQIISVHLKDREKSNMLTTFLAISLTGLVVVIIIGALVASGTITIVNGINSI